MITKKASHSPVRWPALTQSMYSWYSPLTTNVARTPSIRHSSKRAPGVEGRGTERRGVAPEWSRAVQPSILPTCPTNKANIEVYEPDFCQLCIHAAKKKRNNGEGRRELPWCQKQALPGLGCGVGFGWRLGFRALRLCFLRHLFAALLG